MPGKLSKCLKRWAKMKNAITPAKLITQSNTLETTVTRYIISLQSTRERNIYIHSASDPWQWISDTTNSVSLFQTFVLNLGSTSFSRVRSWCPIPGGVDDGSTGSLRGPLFGAKWDGDGGRKTADTGILDWEKGGGMRWTGCCTCPTGSEVGRVAS